MKNHKVYQAEKKGSHYWFVSNTKRDIIEMFPFLNSSDLYERKDVNPEGFFDYVYRDEDGDVRGCKFQEIEEIN